MIFLSYRRDDVPFAVGLLAAALFDRFSPDDVFLDTMANRRGVWVRTRLNRALARTTLMLWIAGPFWDDQSHLDRLSCTKDLVRWELESALARSLPVIPVLVDREWDIAASLPKSLEPLRALTPSRLHKHLWKEDIEGLVRRLSSFLNRHVDKIDDLGHADDESACAVLDATTLRQGIDAMLRHVLPLPQQSSRNLDHLVDAAAYLVPSGDWLRYLVTGHLPHRPSGSALVAVTDQALRVMQLNPELSPHGIWEAPRGDVLSTEIIERRRIGVLEVADLRFHTAGRAPLTVMGIFRQQAHRLVQVLH